MIKFIRFFMIILSITCSNLTDFDQLHDILSQDKKAIIIFTQDNESQEFLNIKKNIEQILQKYSIQNFYEIKSSSCSQFESFCKLEKIQTGQNIIYLATKYENQIFQFSQIEQLEQYLKVNIKQVSFQEILDLQNKNSNKLSIIFGGNLDSEDIIKIIDTYIKKCLSDCFNSDLIENFLLINMNELPQKFSAKNDDQKIVIMMVQNDNLQKVPIQYPTSQDFIDYINIHTINNVLHLNKKNFLKIFQHPIDHKFFYFNKGNQCDKFNLVLDKVLKQNQEDDLISQRILFVEVKIPANSDEANFFIEKYLGQEEIENDTCYLLAQEVKDNDLFKYIKQIDNNTTYDEVIEFKDNFLDRKIEDVYLKSEQIQESQKWEDTNIDKIVSKNFKEKVINNQDDYFLVIVEENNINSKILLKFLNLMKKQIPTLDMGMIDYSQNEIPLIKTEIFPTFLYYHKNAKQQPAFVADEFSYDQLIQFFNQNSKKTVQFDQDMKLQFLDFIKQIKPEDSEMIEQYLLQSDEL